MTRMIDPPGPCRMCDRSYQWHQDNFVRHPYTPSGSHNELRDTTRDKKPSQTQSASVVHTSVPFDPVLRLVLIEKGIISPQDLSEAEKKLGVVMRLVDDKLGDTEDGRQPSSVDSHKGSDQE